MRRLLVFASFLLWTLSLFASQPDAKSLLRDAAAHYRNAQSFRLEFETKITSWSSFSNGWSKRIHIVAVADHKYHYEVEGSSGRHLRINDGESDWFYNPLMHQYSVQPSDGSTPRSAARGTAAGTTEGWIKAAIQVQRCLRLDEVLSDTPACCNTGSGYCIKVVSVVAMTPATLSRPASIEVRLMQVSRSAKEPKSGTAVPFMSRKRRKRFSYSQMVALLLCTVTFSPPNTRAYSVFTHQELIDLAWNDSIRPLLLAKFPGATEEQLREAHAYAYGGSAVQDMGYYPFGKQFFSNLTHYVRSGDFVAWLLSNARSLDEYAFAIGALSHYLGDSVGRSEAINRATAVEFPKLANRFGPSVTYDESPHGHIRTEFAFDIAELSDGDFPSAAYMRYIGFKVPRTFLEEAFQKTYGFDIHEVLGQAHPALRSYRTSVRSFIPAFAEAEVVLHRHQFPPHLDSEADRIFRERLARTAYERRWKHTQKGPGVKAHLLAVLVFVVPKIGAASDLAIKIPNPQTYEMYQSSVNHTVDIFRDMLHKLGNTGDDVKLVNIDLDTGDHVKRGEYPLADATYARLLERLTSKPDRVIPAETKRNIMTYYGTMAVTDKPNPKRDEQLATLRIMKASD